MKTKLVLSALLSFSFCLLSSQVPLGFNYQAIARNANGVPIASQSIPVRISIVTALTGGTVMWQEEFSSVTTDAYGLISLVVGNGTHTGGSATSFSAIDWSAQTLFLKIEIKYPGTATTWTDMGTSQIWSVPYSLLAKNIAPLSKLGITGTTDDMEDALFEVKNKTGQTVFAVYNEGIRAYVGNGDAKGKRGGFAVGGYDATKGSTIYDLLTLSTDSARIYVDSKPTLKGARGGFSVGGYDMTKGGVRNYLDISNDSVRIYLDSDPSTKGKRGGFSVGGYDMTKGGIPAQDYMHVSKDSVRIYIDSNPLTKGKKGGFAVGGYDMTKGTNDNYLNVNTDASGIVKPVNRILWYPLKNAFLTGKVRIGTPDSVGENSFASGYESKARGVYSQALGYKAIANGDYSTAIGKNAVANNINSFAFGDSARATNAEGYAIGRGAVASGYRSFAFGSAGVDTAGKPTEVTRAIGDYSFAIGQGSKSIGKGSFSIGIADTAKGNYSVALGYKASAIGNGAISIGNYSVASNYYATAMGWFTTASGQFSTAMGTYTVASINNATAMGSYTTASGQVSTAMGSLTTASGGGSTAMGVGSTASEFVATAMGWNTVASGGLSTAMGRGTNATGNNSTSMGWNTIASGGVSTAMGYYTTAPSYCETVIGSNNTTYDVGSMNSWNTSDRLFVIGNGANSSSPSNAVTVLKNGNVGIGTSTPGYKLTVNGTTWCSSGAWAGSDIRWKKNITEINNVLSNVLALKPVTYKWKTDEFPEMNFNNEVQIGLVAQDVEKLFPSLVMTDNNGYKAVSYEKLSVVLLEGMKEQQQVIVKQQDEIDHLKSLENEVSELKTLINSLIANQTAQVNKY
jgi:Hep_Hag.